MLAKTKNNFKKTKKYIDIIKAKRYNMKREVS